MVHRVRIYLPYAPFFVVIQGGRDCICKNSQDPVLERRVRINTNLAGQRINEPQITPRVITNDTFFTTISI